MKQSSYANNSNYKNDTIIRRRRKVTTMLGKADSAEDTILNNARRQLSMASARPGGSTGAENGGGR
jgi:hypothetical protein